MDSSQDGERRYLRIPFASTKPNEELAYWLVEVMPDGTAGRDMGMQADGTPIYVTRASQAEIGGPWEMTEPSTRGSPEYQENWGDGLPIPREEFEAIYAEADATLPWTWGGIPTWVSTVGLVVAVAAVVLILLWWGGRLPV